MTLIRRFSININNSRSDATHGRGDDRVSSFKEAYLQFSFDVRLASLSLFRLTTGPELSEGIYIITFYLGATILPEVQ